MFEKDPPIYYGNNIKNTPLSIVSDIINRNSYALDVGCNTGTMGKLLSLKKCICDGVDINDEALELAKPYYRNLFKLDLYNTEFKLTEKYDYILFMDILEHLPRPDLILKKFTKYLKPNGQIIISLPNIARIEIRLRLLLGNFDLKPGILHPDHLKYFTLKTGKKLITECKLDIVDIRYSGLGNILKIFPTLFAFQNIYICCKKNNQKG